MQYSVAGTRGRARGLHHGYWSQQHRCGKGIEGIEASCVVNTVHHTVYSEERVLMGNWRGIVHCHAQANCHFD